MPPSFVFGGDLLSYTELNSVTYSGEPVYRCSKDSLYLYREGTAWIVGKCLNDLFDVEGWQPVWSCAGDPRQNGKHTWKNLADGKTGEYTTHVLQASCVSTASSAVGVSNSSQQELAVPVRTRPGSTRDRHLQGYGKRQRQDDEQRYDGIQSQELAVPVMTDGLRQCPLRFHPSCKDGEVELTNDRCEAWVRESLWSCL